MPVDVVGSGWQRFDDRNDKLPLVLWVSGRTAVSMRAPLLSLMVNPENFGMTFSEKVNRISFGAGTVAPCPGLLAWRAGWA